MSLGNRYGIQMDNILSTASNIKTARLNREVKQRTLDKDKARERNTLAKIKKGQKGYEEEADTTGAEQSQNALLTKEKDVTPKSSENAMSQETSTDTPVPDEITGTTDDPAAQPNALNVEKNVFGQDMAIPKMTDEEMADYALDNESYGKLVAQTESAKLLQSQYQQKLATLQVTMPDATPAQRQILAKASVADLKTFTDMIVTADDKVRKIAKEKLNTQARQLFSITQLPQKGTARKDAYTQWRNSQITGVPKDKQQQVMDSIPEWDENAMNWIGEKLASAEETFKTLNDIEAKSVENKNKIKAETTKHLRQKDEVYTEGSEDVTIEPTKKGWKEKNRTDSNALLKANAKAKKSGGGAKTADYSLINKATWQNLTGYDIDNTDDRKQIDNEFVQESRDIITKLVAVGSRLLREGKAGSPTEAVQMAKDLATAKERKALDKIEKKRQKFKDRNNDPRFR